MQETLSYRQIMRRLLAERMNENPQLSLRAIAGHIGISHTLLSSVLRGRKNLSRQTAMQVADWLRLTGLEREQFITLCELEGAKKTKYREEILEKLASLGGATAAGPQLTLDAFRTISEWYHAAILELMRLHPRGLTVEKAAQALELSKSIIIDAFDRLERLELAAPKNDKWFRAQGVIKIPGGVPNEYLRKFHKQMISKAVEAIDGQSLDERYITGLTIAVRSADRKKIQDVIEKCKSEIRKISDRADAHDDVCQLNIQFFNLLNRRTEP